MLDSSDSAWCGVKGGGSAIGHPVPGLWPKEATLHLLPLGMYQGRWAIEARRRAGFFVQKPIPSALFIC